MNNTIEISQDLTIECVCGNALDADLKVRRGLNLIVISPCEDCKKESYEKGYDDGNADNR
jgi:hypothetical protein